MYMPFIHRSLKSDTTATSSSFIFPFLSRKASRIVSSNQTQLTDKSYMGSPVALLPGS